MKLHGTIAPRGADGWDEVPPPTGSRKTRTTRQTSWFQKKTWAQKCVRSVTSVVCRNYSLDQERVLIFHVVGKMSCWKAAVIGVTPSSSFLLGFIGDTRWDIADERCSHISLAAPLLTVLLVVYCSTNIFVGLLVRSECGPYWAVWREKQKTSLHQSIPLIGDWKSLIKLTESQYVARKVVLPLLKRTTIIDKNEDSLFCGWTFCKNIWPIRANSVSMWPHRYHC